MADTAPHAPLSKEEGIALPLAVLAHALLVAVLVFAKPADVPPPPSERMTVTISEDLAPVASVPNPSADAAPDSGPELGDKTPPPAAEPAPAAPAPQATPVPPQPAVRDTAAPQPRPTIQPKPTPQPKPVIQPKPAVQPKPTPLQKPAVQPKPAPQTKAAPRAPAVQPASASRPAAPRPSPGTRQGASRFDQAFAQGIPGAKAGKSTSAPAAATGAQKSAWTSLIGSKVRGPWNACPVSGLDVEQLRARVHFTLDQAGRVAVIDPPQITGITPANRAQAKPFGDCAVRAIRLAAPFTGLPAEFYSDWKDRTLNFSKR